MDRRYLIAIACIVVLIAVGISYAISSHIICMPSGTSERYYNLIDDDCDGDVDEDYVKPSCGNGQVETGEFCDDGNTINLDGCSSDCKVETDDTIYVASYMGNIDGDFSEEWFHIYDRITEFHDKNAIPSGFSIYPAGIHGIAFEKKFRKMYNSPYIEFVMKGNTGDVNEQRMDELSYDEIYDIISAGKENFRSGAAEAMGIDPEDVEMPVAYNQPQGRFTDTVRDVLHDLGFHIFYEMYINDDLEPVKSLPGFDVLQYGEGFTVEGKAGFGTVFRNPDDIIGDVKDYYRDDVYLMEIEGRTVVPIWLHQSDFEDTNNPNHVDENKWRLYTTTMLRLKQDPDIVMVGPSQIFDMRHPE